MFCKLGLLLSLKVQQHDKLLKEYITGKEIKISDMLFEDTITLLTERKVSVMNELNRER